MLETSEPAGKTSETQLEALRLNAATGSMQADSQCEMNRFLSFFLSDTVIDKLYVSMLARAVPDTKCGYSAIVIHQQGDNSLHRPPPQQPQDDRTDHPANLCKPICEIARIKGGIICPGGRY